MKKLILSVIMLCTMLLSACSINFGDNENDKDTNQEQSDKKNNNESSSKPDNNANNETSNNANPNNSQEQTNRQQPTNNHTYTQNQDHPNEENSTQISREDAIQKAKNVFKAGQYSEFKIDQKRSSNTDYFIKFLGRDATGFPIKFATTVNKETGEVGNLIDDRTEKDKQIHVQHANESKMYKGDNSRNEEIYGRDLSRPNDDERENSKQNNINSKRNQDGNNHPNENSSEKNTTQEHQSTTQNK